MSENKILKYVKKTGIFLWIFFTAFGLIGMLVLMIRDTGKLPDQPNELVDELLDNREITGRLSISITRFHRRIYDRSWPASKVDSNSPYPIGELGNQFIAMAIMLLAERNLLHYEQEIGTLLKGLPATHQGVRVVELLGHTSGLETNGPPSRAPGEATAFASINYQLLARIIETLASQPAQEFIKETIFKPLEMEHTIFLAEPSKVDPGTPALGSGWTSTIEDLVKWDTALNSNLLVPMLTQKKSFTAVKLNNGQRGFYGFNWLIHSDRGLRFEQTASVSPTANASLTRYSQKTWSIIILTDMPKHQLDSVALAREIAGIYLSREMPFPEEDYVHPGTVP